MVTVGIFSDGYIIWDTLARMKFLSRESWITFINYNFDIRRWFPKRKLNKFSFKVKWMVGISFYVFVVCLPHHRQTMWRTIECGPLTHCLYSMCLLAVCPYSLLFYFNFVYFTFWSNGMITTGLFPCIIVIWLLQVYRYSVLRSSFIILIVTVYMKFMFQTWPMQLQKAAKLLDSGAVRATRFLWRYPTARLSLLFYLVHSPNMF